MKDWLLQHAPETVIGALVSVLGFLGVRGVGRLDNHGKRIAELERTTVTRADFDELRGSLTASIVNVGERLETKIDAQNALRDHQTEQLRDDQRVVLQHLLAMKERQ